MPSKIEDLPVDVIDRVEQLASAEITAGSEEERDAIRGERDKILRSFDRTGWIRTDDDRKVFVCYPNDWVVDGTIDRSAIDSLDDAIEIPLHESSESWNSIAKKNRTVAAAIESAYGSDHGENAAAFATFMNNHRADLISHAIQEDIAEFLTEYYPRNVWPSESAQSCVEESLRLTIEEARKFVTD